MDKLFAEADLVVLLGFDICEDVKPSMWLRGREKTIVRLASARNHAETPVHTDRDIVGSLKGALQKLNSDAYPSARTNWAADLSRALLRTKRTVEDSSAQLCPAGIVREVRQALQDDGILCSDIGLHKQYAGLISETTEANTFLCPNGLGSFGSGLPLAIGAQLARPETRVAAIVGDGGFHSNSQDLEFLARYKLPFVLVMMKDSAFGLIRHYQGRVGAKATRTWWIFYPWTS